MFHKISMAVSNKMGSPIAFMTACLFILLWALSGPFMGFSDVWQLTINTATTIITFLMVFLVQASQNNDTRALHQKLDEIIHSIDTANDDVIGIEALSGEEAEQIIARLQREHGNDSGRRPTGTEAAE